MSETRILYRYKRVGHDSRQLELKSDGTIGQGAGRAERRWMVLIAEGQPRLSIFGDHGEICRLSMSTDGLWRGRWVKFEQMPIELGLEPIDAGAEEKLGDPLGAGSEECARSGDLRTTEDVGAANTSNANSHTTVAARSEIGDLRSGGGARSGDLRTTTSDLRVTTTNFRTLRATANLLSPAGVPGRYTYRRVYHDDRLMEFLPNGTIGEGRAGGEQQWALRGQLLEISGEYGVLCRLKQDGDGVWRGSWIQYGRMPIELYPADAKIPPMPGSTASFYYPEIPGFWWSNYDCMARAVRKLCRQLPPLRAVAGIPRSGIIPASLIAQWQNIPLLDIDEALVSRPHLPTYRRRAASEMDERLPILIVDDTVSSGRAMNWHRARAAGKGNYLFAAPYVDHRCKHLVDFYSEDHPQSLLAFEWSLLHEIGHTQVTLCDLDGVIAEEWLGGMEEEFPDAYQRHLNDSKPLCLPTKPLLGIVTGRMHIYREQTEAWLKRYNVEYQQLWMLRAETEKQRGEIGPANFKAQIYAKSRAGLFVESCPQQAKQIHEITGKPVIDFTNMIAHGATTVR